MDYYHCSLEELHRELQRRYYAPFGSRDQLSEGLRADDEARGSEATTIKTEHPTAFAPRNVNLMRTVEFGQTVPAVQMVNQRIIYWDLNTFFPTLQLFFESGLSCTIDGSQLPDAVVGLDPNLRFRLTDCTHGEEGRVTRGVLPKTTVRSSASIKILEATVAQRTSIATQPTATAQLSRSSTNRGAALVHEVHTVIGLRLSGMDEVGYIWAKSEVGYIWAKSEVPSRIAGCKSWGDARIAGLRTDVPVPSVGSISRLSKPGSELTVVEKGSMVSLPPSKPGGLNERGQPWI